MLKYAWSLAGLLILCTCFQNATTRTAAGSAHPQQLNGIAAAGGPHEPAAVASGASSPSSSTLWKDLSLVYRIYKQCALDNLSVCLKVKLLANLEQALRSSKILKLIEGVQFIKTGAAENDSAGGAAAKAPAFSNEQELEAVLPRAADAKEQVLNSMIFKKLATFLQDHTLQVKFPDVRSANHLADNTVESRKKKDKKGGGGGAYIMIPLLLGGTFIPIAYGALAMLAGKALIVSKLALVLASIIGIKKLLSGGGKDSSHEVVVSSGGHSGWGRDMDLAAYSGWKPAKDNVKNM